MIKYLILQSIKLYQKILSPDQGIFSFLRPRKTCRFYPSCSEYLYLTIKKRGLFQGLWQGSKRILKCHPWHPGGIDLP